jgi:hypothetical protein
VLKEKKLKYEGRGGDYTFDDNPNLPAGYKILYI